MIWLSFNILVYVVIHVMNPLKLKYHIQLIQLYLLLFTQK